MFFKSISIVSTVVISLFLSGCSPLFGPSLATVENKTVDDRTVELYSKHNGSPTIVFENGLDGTLQWWSKVIPSLEQNISVFAYNRAGYGRSTPVQSVRDGEHIVEELRTTLKSNAVEPPYILVGHSIGGLYMQYFARKYPAEVKALILVDSTHPNQLHGDGDPKNWPSTTRFLFNILITDNANKEFEALDMTGKEVMDLPTVTDFPVFILSAIEPMYANSNLADDSNAKRIDMVNLYPTAEQYWIDSGHAIPYEKPEAVIDAINSAIEYSKKKERP